LDTAVVYKSLLVVDKQTDGFAGALQAETLKEKKGNKATTAILSPFFAEPIQPDFFFSSRLCRYILKKGKGSFGFFFSLSFPEYQGYYSADYCDCRDDSDCAVGCVGAAVVWRNCDFSLCFGRGVNDERGFC
jgi:hypothetical protein